METKLEFMETKLELYLHELNPQGKSSSKRNNFFKDLSEAS